MSKAFNWFVSIAESTDKKSLAQTLYAEASVVYAFKEWWLRGCSMNLESDFPLTYSNCSFRPCMSIFSSLSQQDSGSPTERYSDMTSSMHSLNFLSAMSLRNLEYESVES
ncbi:hypothetical protein V8G54_012927 [Vigna mungo]|uniref:Uncharacterized protein n=1 Tax=Vigna mungo TaxID=3915 RepID=A0AAQ3S4B4_VIGMU